MVCMVTVVLCTKDIEHHGKLYLSFAVCAVLNYWRSVQRVVRLHFIEQLTLSIVHGLISNTLDLKKGVKFFFPMFSCFLSVVSYVLSFL